MLKTILYTVPDWKIEEWYPTLFSWDNFRDDIKERQKKLDKQKLRKNSK